MDKEAPKKAQEFKKLRRRIRAYERQQKDIDPAWKEHLEVLDDWLATHTGWWERNYPKPQRY